MKCWQKSTALLIFSMALIAVLSTAAFSVKPSTSQQILNSDTGSVGQAHILVNAAVTPDTLSESFEPLEPRKRAKLQANFGLLKEIVPTKVGQSHHKTMRYFMAPSRAPPVAEIV